MNSNLRLALAVVCIIVIALCSTVIANKFLGRTGIDLTEHKIYTLSDGTQNILDKLNQPLRVNLYYSRTAAMKGPEQIRFYNNYYLYVRDLLEEYAGLSNGMLKLKVVDPRPFSDEEEEAIQYGLKRFQLSEDESFFFGVVIQNELGKQKVIEFFEPDRQEFVEYDISKLITDVTRRDKRRIGVISSLPVMTEELTPYMVQMMQMQGRQLPQPWNIVSHLEKQYELETLATDAEEIPAGTDFLMVVHPKELEEKTLFAIDQYVMGGGKLLVFVDPHCMSDEPEEDPSNPYSRYQHSASSDLDSLLKGWGVEMDPKEIAADHSLAIKAQLRNRVEPLVVYLGLNENCVNEDEVITAKLHSLQMLFPGVLRKTPDAETEITPLLTTTDSAGVWKPQGPYELQMPDPQRINKAIMEESEPLMLACMIKGNLKTNFPSGVTSEEDEDAEDADDAESTPVPPIIKQASEDAVVMVFADVDMISDNLAYQQSFSGTSQRGDNASLVLNAFDYLSGTDDLIAIRSRGRFERPFLKVEEIEAEAEMATAEETEALNRKIAEFEKKLREISSGANEENVELMRSAALNERKKAQEEIWKARKELRALNAGKREKIEQLKATLQTHNMVWSPLAVLLIAVILGIVRTVKAKRYAARRM